MDSFKDWLIEEYYKSYSNINKPDFVRAAAFKKVIKKYNEYGTEEIKTNYKDIKVLSKNDIIQRLKNMVVDGKDVLPCKWFSFIVINPNYNPEEFSQTIEESEVMIDFWKEFSEEIHKPEFDFVWNNTLSKLPRNSKEWNKNHSKICPVKAAYFKFMAACVQHDNGIRNYYSDDILDKVIKVSEEYGGIVDFV